MIVARTEGERLVRQFDQEWAAYVQTTAKMLDLANRHDSKGATEFFNAEFRDSVDRAIKALNEVADFNVDEGKKATEEISAHVAAMQSSTGDAVSAIERIDTTISRMNEISSSIAAAMEEHGAATPEIARNVQEAARGTTQVSSNITGLNHSVEETSAAIGPAIGRC